MKFTKKELKNLRKLSDSVKATAKCRSQKQIKDSVETYTIRWQDLEAKRKGYTADINHSDSFKASSYHEALEKLAKTQGFGLGTANMLVIRMSNEHGTYQRSGRLSDLLKTVKDSKVKDAETIKFPNYPAISSMSPTIISSTLEHVADAVVHNEFAIAKKNLETAKNYQNRYLKELNSFKGFVKEYEQSLNKSDTLIKNFEAALNKR